MSEPAPLAAARGAVRDGVAAIENLGTLLGSRRVGPRWLAHAVPVVQAGCAPLAAAIQALEGVLTAELAGDDDAQAAVKAMLAHTAARVVELGKALDGVGQSPIDARERLRVENVVRSVSNDLATMVRLTELLGAATLQRSTEIDLREVLAERRSVPQKALTAIAAAVVELRTHVLVGGDARVLLELLELAVAAVVRAGVTSPRIVADASADGSLVITVGEAGGGPGAVADKAVKPLDVVVRPALPREDEVVRAAARRAGIGFSIAPDGRSVQMVLRPLEPGS